ncbi:MAG: hypothetical protein ACYCQI_12755 [Gammaproteobacteria bacterium]
MQQRFFAATEAIETKSSSAYPINEVVEVKESFPGFIRDEIAPRCLSSLGRVFSTSNPYEIMMGEDGSFILNLQTGQRTKLSVGVHEFIEAVFFLPDGRMLYQKTNDLEPLSDDEDEASQHFYNFVYDFSTQKSIPISVTPKTSVMLSDVLACLKEDELQIYSVRNLNRPFTRLTLDFHPNNIAALGNNTLVVSGTKGEVCAYQVSRGTIKKVCDITQELSTLRKQSYGDTTFVKTLGKERDSLIVIENKLGGLMSRWQWINNNLVKQAHTFHHERFSNEDIQIHELDGGSQFLALSKNSRLTLWDEKFV